MATGTGSASYPVVRFLLSGVELVLLCCTALPVGRSQTVQWKTGRIVNDKFAASLRGPFVPSRDPHHGTRLAGLTKTSIKNDLQPGYDSNRVPSYYKYKDAITASTRSANCSIQSISRL